MVSIVSIHSLIGNRCCLTNNLISFLLKSNKKENDDGFIQALTKSPSSSTLWKLWHEVAECGDFLIPHMLVNSARSIPVSADVGTVIGVAEILVPTKHLKR